MIEFENKINDLRNKFSDIEAKLEIAITLNDVDYIKEAVMELLELKSQVKRLYSDVNKHYRDKFGAVYELYQNMLYINNLLNELQSIVSKFNELEQNL